MTPKVLKRARYHFWRWVHDLLEKAWHWVYRVKMRPLMEPWPTNSIYNKVFENDEVIIYSTNGQPLP